MPSVRIADQFAKLTDLRKRKFTYPLNYQEKCADELINIRGPKLLQQRSSGTLVDGIFDFEKTGLILVFDRTAL